MYPLLLSAVWYGCVVLLKTVSSDEMLDNLRFMFEGILLRMLVISVIYIYIYIYYTYYNIYICICIYINICIYAAISKMVVI